MYAIIDVETTGLSPSQEKIIDIALIIFDGQKVVDEYTSLIHPERSIPANITRLTGITNEMVQDAPKFWEVARDIVLLTEDKTFVAHNVNFDYRFLRKEFSDLGYDFKREKLCTVRLSRRLLPGHRSCSLGNLCKDLGLYVEDRHRAYGDARATSILFQHLLSLDHQRGKPGPIYSISDLSFFRHLPEKIGVYYFLNNQQDIIYIGKSKNIKTRVLSHFQEAQSRKGQTMIEQITDVTCEVTGSELVALLKESHEIKEFKPIYNRKQRRASSDFGVYYYEDPQGYLRFKIDKHSKDSQLLTAFNSQRGAREYLFLLCEQNNLCQKLCGLYKSAGACFYYHVNACKGACIQEESPESYNQRARSVIEDLRLDHQNVFILEEGRTEEEKAVIKIENGRYIGYGYIEEMQDFSGIELLHDVIHPYPDNQDVYRILRSYLKTHRIDRILPY